MSKEYPFDDLFDLVKNHMGWDETKTNEWFDAKNPLLGGTTPHRLIEMGRGHKVRQFIESAIDESKPPEVTRNIEKAESLVAINSCAHGKTRNENCEECRAIWEAEHG